MMKSQQHHTRLGRSGGWQQAHQPEAGDAAAWFAGRVPDGWFTESPAVVVDREEITVIGRLPDPEGSDEKSAQAHGAGRAARFREQTRSERVRIAEEAHARYRRAISWGVDVGDDRILFTHIAVPAMTRLRQPERRVLDTLVDAGIARSRSDALAWCVKLVGEHTDEWLGKLREAMAQVDDLRANGPEF